MISIPDRIVAWRDKEKYLYPLIKLRRSNVKKMLCVECVTCERRYMNKLRCVKVPCGKVLYVKVLCVKVLCV